MDQVLPHFFYLGKMFGKSEKDQFVLQSIWNPANNMGIYRWESGNVATLYGPTYIQNIIDLICDFGTAIVYMYI